MTIADDVSQVGGESRIELPELERVPSTRPDRILVVGSVPPPVAGQSLATEYLLDALGQDVPISIVDLSDRLERGGFGGQLVRAFQLSIRPIQLLLKGRLARGPATVFYLQVGQSRASMLRDLPFLLIARVSRWRMVGHLHGASWRSAFDELGGLLKGIVGRSLAWFDTLIVLTASSKAMFTDVVPDDRVIVVSNAVDPELERRAASHRPIRGDRPTVLYLGNLITGKGVETVGDVAQLAAERSADVRFVVAGAGDPGLLGDLSRAHCEYVGPVGLDEKIGLLERADVLVLLSELNEGQPISVLEGFHYGLPVVATDSGGLVDLIDGDSGRVVEPRSPEQTLDAILDVLESGEWSRISASNRRRAASDFAVATFAEHIRAVLLGAPA